MAAAVAGLGCERGDDGARVRRDRGLVPGVRRRPRVGARVSGVTTAGSSRSTGRRAPGKSTIGRGVATALGLETLDTGAMYRAVTLAVLRAGLDPADADAAAAVARAATHRGGRRRDHARRRRRVAPRSAVPRSPARCRRSRPIPRCGPSSWPASGRGSRSTAAAWWRAATSARSCSPTRAVKVFLTASDEERARRRQRDEAAADRTVIDGRGPGVDGGPGRGRLGPGGIAADDRRRRDRSSTPPAGRSPTSSPRSWEHSAWRKERSDVLRVRRGAAARAEQAAVPDPDPAARSRCRRPARSSWRRVTARTSTRRSSRSSPGAGSGSWPRRSCSRTPSAASCSPRSAAIPVDARLDRARARR